MHDLHAMNDACYDDFVSFLRQSTKLSMKTVQNKDMQSLHHCCVNSVQLVSCAMVLKYVEEILGGIGNVRRAFGDNGGGKPDGF